MVNLEVGIPFITYLDYADILLTNAADCSHCIQSGYLRQGTPRDLPVGDQFRDATKMMRYSASLTLTKIGNLGMFFEVYPKKRTVANFPIRLSAFSNS